MLGYRAHIDEFSLNTLKALNGDYKAYLFASRFMDVYEEYAIGEFREIYSIPLRLSDVEREMMVRALADIHWRYTGEYSFFTKNCATLLQNALRVSWPEFAANENMKSNFLRPDSFFGEIKSSPLADGEILTSLDKAEHDGYYFSSTRQFYNLALNEVKAGMKQPQFNDIESYLQFSPSERRMARENDKEFFARLVNDPHLLEAQVLLEEYAILRGGRMMMIEAAKYIEEQDFLAKEDIILENLDAEHAKAFNECLLVPIKQHANPIKRSNGIPIKSELQDTPSQTSTCQSMQSRKLLQEAIGSIKNAKSDQWQRLNEVSQYWAESIENLKLLKHKD